MGSEHSLDLPQVDLKPQKKSSKNPILYLSILYVLWDLYRRQYPLGVFKANQFNKELVMKSKYREKEFCGMVKVMWEDICGTLRSAVQG